MSLKYRYRAKIKYTITHYPKLEITEYISLFSIPERSTSSSRISGINALYIPSFIGEGPHTAAFHDPMHKVSYAN